METRIKVSKTQRGVKEIIAACYPEWKGRKVFIVAATKYAMADYWFEGSRRYVRAYSLSADKTADHAAGNPFRASAHAEIEIPRDVAMVENSIFCGKDCGVTIYVHPDNMPHLLPPATVAPDVRNQG